MGEVFVHEVPLRFGDVDQAGILYYPRLHHHCHSTMEEWFHRVFGKHYKDVLEGDDVGLPAVRVETDYRVPMPYGLTLRIHASIAKLGRTSVTWRYRVLGEGETLHAEALITTVCVSMERFEKKELPADLRAAFERYCEGE